MYVPKRLLVTSCSKLDRLSRPPSLRRWAAGQPRDLVGHLERAAAAVLRQAGVAAERERRNGAGGRVIEVRRHLHAPGRQRHERPRLVPVDGGVRLELVQEHAAEDRRVRRHQPAAPALVRAAGHRERQRAHARRILVVPPPVGAHRKRVAVLEQPVEPAEAETLSWTRFSLKKAPGGMPFALEMREEAVDRVRAARQSAPACPRRRCTATARCPRDDGAAPTRTRRTGP